MVVPHCPSVITSIFISVTIVCCLFFDLHRNIIIHCICGCGCVCVCACVWLLMLKIMFVRVIISLCYKNSLPYIYPFYSLQTFGLFQSESVMNNTAIKFLYTSPGACVHTFLLGIYQRVELLGYCLCSISVETVKQFSRWF